MLSGSENQQRSVVVPTKEEDFKERFAGIMLDMSASADDAETMWLVGSLAAQIVDHAQQPDWTAFKANLSQPTYRSLLTTFQNQGNALAKQGARRQVFAVEVLAASLVAKTQTDDPELVTGDGMLNDLIDSAIAVFRQASSADPIIS
jgi:hypothetical protein